MACRGIHLIINLLLQLYIKLIYLLYSPLKITMWTLSRTEQRWIFILILSRSIVIWLQDNNWTFPAAGHCGHPVPGAGHCYSGHSLVSCPQYGGMLTEQYSDWVNIQKETWFISTKAEILYRVKETTIWCDMIIIVSCCMLNDWDRAWVSVVALQINFFASNLNLQWQV